jgi:hypothetical protein
MDDKAEIVAARVKVSSRQEKERKDKIDKMGQGLEKSESGRGRSRQCGRQFHKDDHREGERTQREIDF